MNQSRIKRGVFVGLSMFCMVLGLNFVAYAQDAIVTNNKFRIQPSLFLGNGSSSIDVGVTTDGETGKISGGGGAGGGVTAGYGLSSRVDIDLTLGYEKSYLTPAASNADAQFSRSFLLAGLKYRIPVAKRFHVKVGGGGGYYRPGELDINFSEVPGGSHAVVKYKSAFGAHVLTEFEFFAMRNMGINLGMKYYSVTYEASSATEDGMPANITDSKVKKLDGSGVDFALSLAMYF